MNRSKKSLLVAVFVGLVACLAEAVPVHANAPPATLGYQPESVQVAQPNVPGLFLSKDALANGMLDTNREGYSNQVTSLPARPVANAPPQLVVTVFPTQVVLSVDNSCVTTASQAYPLAVGAQPEMLSLGQEVPAVFYTSTVSTGEAIEGYIASSVR